MNTKVVILLTGCVNPNGMIFTELSDVNVRLKQYLQAINFYLLHTSCPIVFVENSNFEISPYLPKDCDKNRLEILTFDGNDYDKTIGKGYGEALIIEYALNNSRFLSNPHQIIKITGRIIIDDIKEIIAEIIKAPNNVVFADINWHRNYRDKLLSVVVSAPSSFWSRFIIKKVYINDNKGVVFENVLKNTADEWVRSGGRFSLFHTPLLYEGVSGSTGLSYTKSHPYLKYYFKLLFYNMYLKNIFGY